MEKYNIVNNYIVFEKLDSDSVGTNYRGGEIQDKKVEKHCLLTEAHAFLTDPPNLWIRIRALVEGIRKQNIPGLYSPETIIEEDEKALLIYPYLNGKSLEQILIDVAQTHTSIELELVFAIVFEIADVLDNSSAIRINKMNTFHGILTPDNIIVDFDGKVYLKNYGIYPFLDNAPELLIGATKRFSDMLAPELSHNTNLAPHSDIYHLGNIIHRLLIGKYYQYLPGEDFESYLSGIDLEEHIMLPQEDYAPKIIEILKRTLNPDPAKRFANIKKFKEYVSTHFHIEELSAATFMMAYFMNLLYKKAMEEAEGPLAEELAYTIPDRKLVLKEPRPGVKAKIDDHMLEDLLIELEQQKRSKVKIIVPFIIILLVVIGIASFLFIKQQKEAQQQLQAQIQKRQEFENRVAQMKAELMEEYQKRLKAIEEKAATTEEEKKQQTDEIERLKQWKTDQEEHQQQVIKARQEEIQRKPQEQPEEKKPVVASKTGEPTEIPVEQQPEVKPPAEQVTPGETKPTDIKESKTITINTGDIVPLDSITFSPSKLSGERKFLAKDLKFSDQVLNQYKGQELTVHSDILVNEWGSILETKIAADLPPEILTKASEILKTWKFIPGEKNKTKVKVWIPAKITIAFEGTPPAAKGAEPEVDITKPNNIVPLTSATFRPSKISGEKSIVGDKLPDDLKKKYAGQTLNINADILINEVGSVLEVNIKENWPNELKAAVTESLKTWKFIPAEKKKVKVKVWMPVKLAVAFGGSAAPAEAKVEVKQPEKPAEIVPWKAVTYKPSKISGERSLAGDKLALPNDIKKKYAGQTLNIDTDVLIDETGNIKDVTLKGNWPNEFKSALTEALKAWRYIAAEKNKVKVKVWMPVKIPIVFEKPAAPAVAVKPVVKEPEIDVTKVTNIIPLSSVSYRPSKVSGERTIDGDKMDIPKDIKKQYKGKSLNVNADLLIDELGSILAVTVKENLPAELKAAVSKVLKTWKYIPAEKDKVKVKVWFSARISVSFK